ncbi:hypothetical protein DFH27DRAFT_656352 [Peziza echinospora]|nr:hypothetical protein DFH27DRAFT_656352 [Peziza echinospora]
MDKNGKDTSPANNSHEDTPTPPTAPASSPGPAAAAAAPAAHQTVAASIVVDDSFQKSLLHLVSELTKSYENRLPAAAARKPKPSPSSTFDKPTLASLGKVNIKVATEASKPAFRVGAAGGGEVPYVGSLRDVYGGGSGVRDFVSFLRDYGSGSGCAGSGSRSGSAGAGASEPGQAQQRSTSLVLRPLTLANVKVEEQQEVEEQKQKQEPAPSQSQPQPPRDIDVVKPTAAAAASGTPVQVVHAAPLTRESLNTHPQAPRIIAMCRAMLMGTIAPAIQAKVQPLLDDKTKPEGKELRELCENWCLALITNQDIPWKDSEKKEVKVKKEGGQGEGSGDSTRVVAGKRSKWQDLLYRDWRRLVGRWVERNGWVDVEKMEEVKEGKEVKKKGDTK